jgi:hypothetical protein
MRWFMDMKDGKRIYEYDKGIHNDFVDIDKTNMEKFCIIDSTESLIHFNGDNGDMKFSNLDLRELNKLSGGEKLSFTYDAHTQSFRMTRESLEFYHKLLLEESKYNYISFDQTGVFDVSGIPFYMSITNNGNEYMFKDNGPYQDVVHFKDAITDFVGARKNDAPHRRFDAVLKYTIGYNKQYLLEDNIIDATIVLEYSVVTRQIIFICRLKGSQTLNGRLNAYFGDKACGINLRLDKNEFGKWDRLLTMI